MSFTGLYDMDSNEINLKQQKAINLLKLFVISIDLENMLRNG